MVEPTYAKATSTVGTVVKLTSGQLGIGNGSRQSVTAQNIADAISIKGKAYHFRVTSVIFSTGWYKDAGAYGNSTEAPEAVVVLGASRKQYVNDNQNKPCKVRIPEHDPAGQIFNVTADGVASGAYAPYTGPIFQTEAGTDIDQVIVTFQYTENL